MSHGFSRHRRSGASVATFSAFEADLLRSLAGQLIELLRNEEATPGQVDPFEEPLDFSGRPEDERSSRVLREVTETVRHAVQQLSGQQYVDSYGSSVKAAP